MKIFVFFLFISFLFFSCAQEQEELFTITYFGNGNTSGLVPVDTNQYKSGNSAVIKSNGDLSKLEYNFSCWNTQADNTGYTFYVGNSISVTSNISLFATWIEVDKYTVSFINEGESYLEPIIVLLGEKINEPEKPLKQGYTFLGWFIDEGAIRWDFLTNSVTKNITLYSKWELIPLNTVGINNRFSFEKTEWIQNGDEKIYTINGKLQYTLFWIDPNYSTFDHIEITSISNGSLLHTIDKGVQQLVVEYGPYDDIISNHNLSYGKAKTVDIYGNKSDNTYCPSIPGSFGPSIIPSPWTIDISDVKYENNLITWINPTDARFLGLLLVESGRTNFQTRNIFLERVTSYIPSKNSNSLKIYSINSIGGGLSSGVTINYGPPGDITITNGYWSNNNGRYEIYFINPYEADISHIEITIDGILYYDNIPSTYIAVYLYQYTFVDYYTPPIKNFNNDSIVLIKKVNTSGIKSYGVTHIINGVPN